MFDSQVLPITDFTNAPGAVPEGPVWSDQDNCLYWPDIVTKQVSRYCVKTKTIEVQQFDFPFSAIALCGAKLVLVANNGLYAFEFNSSSGDWLLENAGLCDEHRFNDAKVDAAGRLWIGTLRIGLATDSAGVFCFDVKNGLQQKAQNYTAANGLGWSPCNQHFYIIDTVPQHLYRYDFDLVNGEISNKTLLIDFNEMTGKPDGMCVDSLGNIWVAMWDGWSVLVFDSQGKALHTIDVPMPKATCITFGGDKLDTAFITTSSFGLDETSITQYPLAGTVLMCKPGCTGLPTYHLLMD